MWLFRLLTDFDGRIGLARFWFGSAVVALCLLAIRMWAPQIAGYNAASVVAFSQAFALFPWAALAAKRATDRGSVPLFGILLICAIVLPGQLKAALPVMMEPSLDTIALLAWLAALVDLGLMPSVDPVKAVAEPPAGAKAAPWTRQLTPPSTLSP